MGSGGRSGDLDGWVGCSVAQLPASAGEQEEEGEEEEEVDNIQVSGGSMPPLGRLFSRASTIGGAF